jgi:hypothetical protein
MKEASTSVSERAFLNGLGLQLKPGLNNTFVEVGAFFIAEGVRFPAV